MLRMCDKRKEAAQKVCHVSAVTIAGILFDFKKRLLDTFSI